ncbi:MAG TPA: DNA polymerase III subunit delta [Gemmatimonadales bacterium]|nr:DNA polymerase III subunit delta [Gemmatimonadales bacterium]
MASQKIEALSRAVRAGTLAPLYYLHGPEQLLKEEAIRAILDAALDPGLREFNLDQRSAAELDPETLHGLCHTPPMMSERRALVIRDVEAWKRKPKVREAYLRYAERPAADVVVILVQGAGDDTEDRELARGAVSAACEPFTPERAARWVVRRAEQRGIAIEPAAAEHLVRVAGTELGGLAVEIEKLAGLPKGAPITAARVGEVVGVRHGETMQDWRDAILAGDTARASRLLGPVLAQAGVSGVRVLTVLGTALVGVSAARDAYDRGLRDAALERAVFDLLRRVKPQGIFGYKEEAERWARAAPAWPPERLRAGLRATVAADVALKGTTISGELGILQDLTFELAPGAAVAA